MALQASVYVRDVTCPNCGALYALYGPEPGSPVTMVYSFLTCEACGAVVAEAPTGGYTLQTRSPGMTSGIGPAPYTPRVSLLSVALAIGVAALTGGLIGYAVADRKGAVTGVLLGIPVGLGGAWVLARAGAIEFPK